MRSPLSYCLGQEQTAVNMVLGRALSANMLKQVATVHRLLTEVHVL